MPLKNHRGFTLMELIVVIGIMAMMMGLAVGFIGNSFSSQVRKESSHLISVIRYAYNQASVAGKPYRLVFDLSEQMYWLEAGPDTIVVSSEDETDKAADSGKRKSKKGKVTEEKADAEEKTGEDKPDETELQEVPPPAAFSPVDEDVVKKVKLGDQVFIRDVYVIHQKDIVADEKAYLYFFPSGMTEMAVLHLSNEEQDKNISLIVNPVTGSVKVEPDYIEHETLLRK